MANGHDEACPGCGSADLAVELRDPVMPADGSLPPPRAYGAWVVCQRCGREWPDPELNPAAAVGDDEPEPDTR